MYYAISVPPMLIYTYIHISPIHYSQIYCRHLKALVISMVMNPANVIH